MAPAWYARRPLLKGSEMTLLETLKQARDALIEWDTYLAPLILGRQKIFEKGSVGAITKEAITNLSVQIERLEKAEIGNGCKCSICGEWQIWTPSGMVCKNGHGGAPGVNTKLYVDPPEPAIPVND